MQPFHLFTVASIPVRVHWAYLLLAAFFGYQFMPLGPVYPVVFVLCMTVSLLVHELGHAFVARRFGLGPQVLLHGFGGLTFHEPAPTNRHDAWIIAAGPAAGLLLALVAWIAVQIMAPASAGQGPSILLWSLGVLFYINLLWSLLNLIPLWPLDGGQLFRLGLMRFVRDPARAERLTHLIGVGLAITLTIIAVAVFRELFGAIIAAMLGFQNWQRLNARADGAGPARARNNLADELLVQATAALAAGDPAEALRLGYQVKDEKQLTAHQLDAMWSVLTVASAELGEHDEALSYSLRAPRIGPVFSARIKALVGLGKLDEARRELRAEDAPPMNERQRQEIEALLA